MSRRLSRVSSSVCCNVHTLSFINAGMTRFYIMTSLIFIFSLLLVSSAGASHDKSVEMHLPIYRRVTSNLDKRTGQSVAIGLGDDMDMCA